MRYFLFKHFYYLNQFILYNYNYYTLSRIYILVLFVFIFKSLDYDPCENNLLLDEERKKGYKFVIKKKLARWFIFLLIGICTALIACFVDISIEELSSLKYGLVKKCILFFNYLKNKTKILYYVLNFP